MILIIGILAAIAIPSFLNQKGKASDAAAKELAHTAQVAIETCATDNNGAYTGACDTPVELAAYETTIATVSGSGNAWLKSVTTPAAGGYTLTTQSTTGDLYNLQRTANGTLVRTCSDAAGQTACPANSSW